MISPGFVLGRSLKNSVRSWDAVGIEGLYSVAGTLNEKVLHGCFGIRVARLARLFCLCTASLIVTAQSHGFEFVLASLRHSPHGTTVCNNPTELKSNNAMLLCPSPRHPSSSCSNPLQFMETKTSQFLSWSTYLYVSMLPR